MRKEDNETINNESKEVPKKDQLRYLQCFHNEADIEDDDRNRTSS